MGWHPAPRARTVFWLRRAPARRMVRADSRGTRGKFFSLRGRIFKVFDSSDLRLAIGLLALSERFLGRCGLLLRPARNKMRGVKQASFELPAELSPCRAEELDVCLKPLFAAFPAATDSLLDLRAAWLEGRQPGVCVRMYFKLRARVPAWRGEELRPLLDLLEQRIRLWIVIRESEQRRSDCLGLERADSLDDYCQMVMREVARRESGASRLDLSFGWAA